MYSKSFFKYLQYIKYLTVLQKSQLSFQLEVKVDFLLFKKVPICKLSNLSEYQFPFKKEVVEMKSHDLSLVL